LRFRFRNESMPNPALNVRPKFSDLNIEEFEDYRELTH
jgi:hypothetical protein